MALNEEEEEEEKRIKEHLLRILSKFPKEKRDIIEKNLKSMTKEEFGEFVEKNELTNIGKDCLFCSIVSGDTPSYKIFEDEENLAILEINPISKGNSLIVPKEHKKEINENTKKFAFEVAKKIKESLNPKDIKLVQKSYFDHSLLEIIPVYGKESERKPARKEELEETLNEIKKPKKEIITKKEEAEEKSIPKLPPRIP